MATGNAGFMGFIVSAWLGVALGCTPGTKPRSRHLDSTVMYVERAVEGRLFIGKRQTARVNARQLIFELESRPDILCASVVAPVRHFAFPNDTYFKDDEWAFTAVQVYAARGPSASRLSTGTGVFVGVLDSGVGPNGDLDRALTGGWDVPYVFRNRSFRSPIASEYGDDDEHGTLVAGIIGAQKNNKKAIAGVAPGVSLFALRDPLEETAGIAEGILQSVRQDNPNTISVLNISSGSLQAEEPAVMTVAVEAALSEGLLVVAAAGNDADGENTVIYPAALPNVLGVGAVIDRPGSPQAAYSQLGWYVDLVAPGEAIRSTIPASLFSGFYPTRAASGTSLAAPFVSGAAALVSAHGQFRCRTRPTKTERRKCVVAIARRLQGTALRSPGVHMWTPEKGAGLLQAYSAMIAEETELDDLPTPPEELVVSVAGQKIRLTWTAPERGRPDAYRVYRDGVRLGLVAGTRFEDTPPKQAALSYQVTAVTEARGESFAAPLWLCRLARSGGYGCEEWRE